MEMNKVLNSWQKLLQYNKKKKFQTCQALTFYQVEIAIYE